MRDVRTMLDLLKKDASNFRSIYEDRYGRQKPCFALDRELTLTLVSGYDVPLRHRVVTRLGELEAAQNSNSKVPVNFSAALRLAAEQAERIESQAAIIECQQPAVEFVERFVESSGLKGFREAAKLLGANEARFREFLESEGVFYRLNGSLMPYQHHVYAKRFVVKTGVSGGGHSFSTAKFTAKGFAWIAGLWGAHESEAANV